MADLLHKKQLAYGVKGPKEALVPIEFTPPSLGDHDVFVDVKYCGMCHSDLHKTNDEWDNNDSYPLVPGHEVVGLVAAVGPKVTTVKVGQRVGFGPQRGSCGSCKVCQDSAENTCALFEGLYDPKFGGYATSITVPEKFTFLIPESIPNDVAGPLLCAGITTFAPLARNVKAGDRVGIVGIGGLGHMALQYARAMGAISTSPDKEAEARKFGANNFLVSKSKEQMESAEGSFDFILCTASGNVDLNMYLLLLKSRSTLSLVGLAPVETPLAFYPFSIVNGQKRIEGSIIGSPSSMREMLAFSAEHKCYPQVEVIPFEKANYGYDRIKEGSARYRMVLKIEGAREEHFKTA